MAKAVHQCFRRSPGADNGTNELRGAPRREWRSDPRSPWPEMAGENLSPLSDLFEKGLKPAMDHTHEGNQARTNVKASARILKQSKRCGQGALKKIKCAPILTPQRESWCISSADLEGISFIKGKLTNKPLWQYLFMAEVPRILYI